MFKVDNKSIKRRSMTSFWCLYCQLLTYFAPYSSVSIVFLLCFYYVIVCYVCDLFLYFNRF